MQKKLPNASTAPLLIRFRHEYTLRAICVAVISLKQKAKERRKKNLSMDAVVEDEGVTEFRAKLISIVNAVPYPLYHRKREGLPRVCASAKVLQERRYQDGLPAMPLSHLPRKLGGLGLINVDGLHI